MNVLNESNYTTKLSYRLFEFLSFKKWKRPDNPSIGITLLGFFSLTGFYWLIEAFLRINFDRFDLSAYLVRVAVFECLYLYTAIVNFYYSNAFKKTFNRIILENIDPKNSVTSHRDEIVTEYLSNFPSKRLVFWMFIPIMILYTVNQINSILFSLGKLDRPVSDEAAIDSLTMGPIYSLIGFIIIPYLMFVMADAIATLLHGIVLIRKMGSDTRLHVLPLSSDNFGGFRGLVKLNLLGMGSIMGAVSVYILIGIFFFEIEGYIIFQIAIIAASAFGLFILIYPLTYLMTRVGSQRDIHLFKIHEELNTLNSRLLNILNAEDLKQSREELEAINSALGSLEIVSTRLKSTQTFPIDLTLISSLVSSFGIPLILYWITVNFDFSIV